MSIKLQAIRGMNDILPSETPLWQYFHYRLMMVLRQYGYAEIRLPIVEHTELFARSIGEGTDVVEKEMYTFLDRNGESLTLRPEGTASCVRAAVEHGLLHNQTQRLWYFGPMFRYERPQKGRYRQFYQVGIECFGIAEPTADVELLALTARLWKQLGIADKVELQINTLGTPAVRQAHREALVTYLQAHAEQLDEDSQRRLHKNPLRILDSKNPAMQALIAGAPQLMDYLDEASQQHFAHVKKGLEILGIAYRINPCLVRGLDYYTHTVFEWVTTELGAQGTICAGGRYDGLVEQCGGRPTPAVGCAMGVERLLLMVQQQPEFLAKADVKTDLYILSNTLLTQVSALELAEHIRQALPTLKVDCHCGLESFKSQFKKADKSGAQLALILGEEEYQNGQVAVKWLREERAQQTLSRSALVEFLQQQWKQ